MHFLKVEMYFPFTMKEWKGCEYSMENVNKELQEHRRKNHYVVETKRDTKLMLTFIEFKNRVEHPAATVYMITMGVMLIGLMYKQADSIAMVGKVIGYIFGAVLILMGLFRKYISVYMMKNMREVDVAGRHRRASC